PERDPRSLQVADRCTPLFERGANRVFALRGGNLRQDAGMDSRARDFRRADLGGCLRDRGRQLRSACAAWEDQPHSRPIAGGMSMYDRKTPHSNKALTTTAAAFFAVALGCQTASAQEARITKTDTQIDALDPGIRLFVREKMQDGNTQFTNENVVLFLHGAT